LRSGPRNPTRAGAFACWPQDHRKCAEAAPKWSRPFTHLEQQTPRSAGVQRHDTSTQKHRRWSEFYRPRGACLAVTGGCFYPTGRLGDPNHLHSVTSAGVQETASLICDHGGGGCHGAVGLWAEWRRAGLQSAQGRKHVGNCNWGRRGDCRVSGGPARLRLRMAILEQNALARRSPCGTAVVTTAGFKTKPPFLLPQSATANLATVLVGAE
jgi:hypothetical protein